MFNYNVQIKGFSIAKLKTGLVNFRGLLMALQGQGKQFAHVYRDKVLIQETQGQPKIIDFELIPYGENFFLLIQDTHGCREHSLIQLNKKIDLNIAKIAHDMRTPINSILMSNNHL